MQLPQRFYDLSGMTPFYEDPDFAKVRMGRRMTTWRSKSGRGWRELG